eukprot:364745-Chlamydomonas_euryale.AAC.9
MASTVVGATDRMLGDTRPKEPMAIDKTPAKTNFLGRRCLECPRRPDPTHQLGHMGLTRVVDAC